MSALAVTDRRGSTRKPRAHAGHLWPVPAADPTRRPGVTSRGAGQAIVPDAGEAVARDAGEAVVPDAGEAVARDDAELAAAGGDVGVAGRAGAVAPVTVNITFDGTDAAGRERVLAALRELVAVAGGTAEVRLPAASASAASTSATGAAETDRPAEPGVIHLEPKPRTVARDGQPLHLSRLEYDLLLFLARNPRQVFSRAQLLTQVWGHTHTTRRTVDVHVSRLRTKLDGHELVTTVYGLGYRLADDVVVTIAG